jgi:WD40 repeat protein
MNRKDSALSEILAASCRRAWDGWTNKYPKERFYAFALYTTMDGEYFVPSICGDEGLTKVARQYVKQKSFTNLDGARSELRWSFPDSPYHAQGERYNDGVDDALDRVPIPYDKSGRAADKVIKTRLDAAVTALQSLDKRGVFGKGALRKKIVLLIEAGDRDQEWALKFAKRLNPADVYTQYAKQFEPKKLGKFTELGSKKVYISQRLSASADRKVLLAVSEDEVFCFDMQKKKQLWCRKARRGDDLATQSAAISADGTVVAVAWASAGLQKEHGLAVWSGKDWKQTHDVRLPAQPFDIVMHPDAKWAAVSCDDSTVRIIDITKGKPIKLLKRKEWARRIDVSADGKWLASADVRGGIVLWNTSNWTAHKQLKRPADFVAFDGKSRLLAATLCYSDKSLPASLLDAVTGKVVKELSIPGWKIKRSVLSPDGKRIACALEHGSDIMQQKAVLLDVKTEAVLSELAADFEDINDFCFLADNKSIAVAVHGHHRKPVILWSIGTSKNAPVG